MELTREQQAILDGSQGEVYARIMKTLVMYGETFGATKMVPVTSTYGHIVTSFGVIVIKGVFDLMDELIAAGVTSKQKFSADPRPVDKNVPSNLLQDIVFKVMYGPQKRYEEQLKKIGLLRDDAFTCACYFPEVGNRPNKGDILSWAESSAVNYANSVLGARCNRNSGIIEMFGSILGFVPYFGLLTDEGRKASWIVEINTTRKPEAQLLGSAIGMKVMEYVPYIKGLDGWIGTELNDDACAYLKDFGAATASNGAVGLYHIDRLTPEAVEQGESLIKPDAKVYVIDDAELERVKASYPVIWKDKDATPRLCFMGRVVVPGEVTLKALVSHGGFNTLASFKDCKEGKNTCTDQNNPDLYGKSTVGVALCLPQTIGSTTGGMVLYNSAVIGCNPGALLFSNTIDSLAAAGAILASVWTPNNIPTVDELGQEFLDHVKDGMTIEIRANGEVLVTD